MKRALDGVVVLSAATLILIASIGGIDIQLGQLSIRAHDWQRPAIALVFALGVRAAFTTKKGVGRVFRRKLAKNPPDPFFGGATFTETVAYAAIRGLLALVAAAVLAYSQFHVRVAGGLDSYGYVSAAEMIASGHLSEPQPLASLLPFPDPLKAATPLGHVPAIEGFSSVPRFPIGLPIMMALFSVLHSTGPFFVPLVMAYVTVALAYPMGRRSSDRLTGLFAAALIAVDPVFVVSAVHPMSDVPAACWLVAAVGAVDTDDRHRSRLWNMTAGICAGMAMLTRPVLVPAILAFLLIQVFRTGSRSAWVAAATTSVFLLLQIWLNATLYGTMTMSGYGSASHMFELSFSRMAANLANFGKWLIYSRSTLFWLAWPGALVVLRHDRRAWELSAIAAAAAAPYLFYLVFDNWDSARFLLPTIVLVLILCARALSQFLSRRTLAEAWRPAVLFTIAFACGFFSQQFLQREGIGRSRLEEAKYALVGEWFRRNTSERAVVLSSLHSGAIRMYGRRPTIRWDEIPGDALDATIERLMASDYEPYLALDTPSEPPIYEDRFGGQSANAEPIARVRVVSIYKFASTGK